jgi:hypothetical protein
MPSPGPLRDTLDTGQAVIAGPGVDDGLRHLQLFGHLVRRVVGLPRLDKLFRRHLVHLRFRSLASSVGVCESPLSSSDFFFAIGYPMLQVD